MERLTGKQAQSMMEAVASVYEKKVEPTETEQVEEGLAGTVDKVTKTLQGGLEKMGVPINRTKRGTATKADQEKKIQNNVKVEEGMGRLLSGALLRKAADAAKKSKTEKDKPPTKEDKPSMKEDADLFDIIKGHLIDEGLTEEEALKKMLTLTDDEREAILDEGIGSMLGSVVKAAAGAVKNSMQSGTKRTGNINLPPKSTGAARKPRGEDIFTSTPPGGKPYGNKKPLPKPGTPAAERAPMRDEPLF